MGKIPIIVDIKSYSPKEGDLFRGRTYRELALTFKNAGAPALAVITEKDHFRGSMEALSQIVEAGGLPVLRKDFITEVKDIEDTVKAGASAILLICSMHSPNRFKELFLAAHEMGLEALVETHTAQELEFAAVMGAKLIGINNKDILKLELDDGNLSETLNLIMLAPKDTLVISESGLHTRADVCAAVEAGADALLIGSALIKAKAPAEYYKFLSNARRKYDHA